MSSPLSITPIVYIGAARVANLLVGLAMIPLLLHSLGGEGFAAWAILWATGVVFATLDLGTSSVLRKEVAIALNEDDADRLTTVISNRQIWVVCAYLVILPLIVTFGSSVAEKLKLSTEGPMVGSGLLLFIFLCVFSRTLLTVGDSVVLYAGQRFIY